jgi:hypothetical protein
MFNLLFPFARFCPQAKEKLALLNSSHDSVKIDPFLFDDQRPLQHLGVNGADVFADDTDKDQLNGGKEKQTDDQRRHAYLKVFPENQFISEITQGHQ